MGKSDENQTKTGAHKATDGESKLKNKPSFDTLESSPLATTFEATDDGGNRHSRWKYRFRELCEYKAQFGHCRVPQRYAANPQLGSWVLNQRYQHRNKTEGEATPRTAEHIRALDGIGFHWGTTKNDFGSIRSARFQQLCEDKVQFGHCRVPQEETEGEPAFLTDERIREFESMGFEWGQGKTNWRSRVWSVRFQQLCEYKVQFGHCRVPRTYAVNPKLGSWVSNARFRYRMNKEVKSTSTTAEQIRALDGIGFDWGMTKTDLASI